MALNALRGALGFLSRFPVGHDAAAWEAFRRRPLAFPLAGYLVGGIVALPLLAPVPGPTAAAAFVAGVYLVTGINHVDGVADVGDAAVVHGDAAERREVMRDTVVGVGGALAVGLVLVGLFAAGIALIRLPASVVLLAVAAEVGAKAGMAALVCLGTATHEGLASTLTERTRPRDAVPVIVAALPAAALPWLALPVLGLPVGNATTAAGVVLAVALGVALVTWAWARRTLGGVSGDVFGAANEFARVAALHAGVIAWTLS